MNIVYKYSRHGRLGVITSFQSYHGQRHLSVKSHRNLLEAYDSAKRLCFSKKPPPDVNPRAVFANNEIHLRNVSIYGFDYDYTLAHYKPSMHHLIYDLGKKALVEKFKYPKDIENLRYLPEFAVRGLHYDIHKGLLIKVDSFNQIQLGSVYSMPPFGGVPSSESVSTPVTVDIAASETSNEHGTSNGHETGSGHGASGTSATTHQSENSLADEPPIAIRPLTVSDCEQLVDLLHAINQLEGRDMTLPQLSAADLTREAFGSQPPSFRCVVAERAGRLVGHAIFTVSWAGYDGIGKCLYMTDLLGAPHIDFNVYAWNEPAVRFYAGFGCRSATAESRMECYYCEQPAVRRLAEAYHAEERSTDAPVK
ncbi:5'-nucleotidase domain-containing protein 3 [Amphibalanus amphitrite]|uniref:5'-nucleotidase domain-containing protein 3 n=1 Tax=Amphibalanus amphitrite TaxID=1232801 RepID=A0A6A4V4Y8_AMPAM|nr:5'-nucleotidase domain-containing protein 3 [Amphibalanus amphitrite]